MSGSLPGSEIWIVCETRAGRILESCFELIGEALRLASHRKAHVAAVLFAGRPAEETSLLFAAGADKVYLIGSGDSQDHDGAHAMAVATAARQYAPEIILMPATIRGRSVAPQVAARLQTGLTADCTAFRIDEDGLLVQTRPAFGGSLMAEIICADARPQMATARPKIFPLPAFVPSRQGETIIVPSGESPPGLLSLLRAESLRDSGAALGEAAVILSGGMGLGSREAYERLSRLARIMGASCGASRAAVHAGFAPYSSQIGQTGLAVRPCLYVAFGISGSVQHRAGMAASDRIIAVNTDPKAPIFRIAHIGIIADCNEVLALLTEEFREAQD